MAPTHYDTLEISARASPEVVRAAYRSLIQRFHPDRRPGDTQAAARAAAITAAYEVLSDPVQRAAYDQALAAAGPASRPPPARPEAARPQPQGGGRANGLGSRWPLGGRGARALVALAVTGALAAWLALGGVKALVPHRPDPQAELASIRLGFAQGGQPEVRLLELHARKLALLRQFPPLQGQAATEETQDRQARTVDLLDAPLRVQLPGRELSVPRLRVVLGSLEAGVLRGRMVQQGARLSAEVASTLARADVAQLDGPLAEAYLKATVLGTLARELGTRPEEPHPPTYFESPGRRGPVEVLLPEGFELRP